MSKIIVYWVIGCIIVGVGMGRNENDCPEDTRPSVYKVAAAVAVWPSLIAWSVTVKRVPKTACEHVASNAP